MPVMAFRAVLGNVSSNSWREYLYALSVCAGVAIFTVADQTSSKQASTARMPSRIIPCSHTAASTRGRAIKKASARGMPNSVHA